MHACLALLNEAHGLALAEAQALELEDAERAGELSQTRAELLQQAWEQREGFDKALLKDRLLALAAMQDDLIRAAAALQDSLREKIGQRKKQEGYFTGSRKRQAENQKAFYLSKIS